MSNPTRRCPDHIDGKHIFDGEGLCFGATCRAEKPNLYDEVMAASIYDCKKHNLADDPEEYAERQFNRLNAAAQLREISDALERLAENGR